MIRFFTLALILCSISLFGGSVRVYNDSPFPLTAEILAADGSSQGSLTVAPQQQSQWQDYSGKNAAWSQTPYTVIFTCKSGKQFGLISGVQQGATINAMSAKGDLFCETDKNQQQKTQPGQKPKQSQQQQQSEQQPFNPYQTPYDPNQSPYDPLDNPQGSSSPDSAGPADPSSAPGDPIWGPP